MPETLESPPPSSTTPERTKSKPVKPPVFHLRDWHPNKGHVTYGEDGQLLAGVFHAEIGVSTGDQDSIAAFEKRRTDNTEAALQAIRKAESDFKSSAAYLNFARVRDRLTETEKRLVDVGDEARQLDAEIVQAVQAGKEFTPLRLKLEDRNLELAKLRDFGERLRSALESARETAAAERERTIREAAWTQKRRVGEKITALKQKLADLAGPIAAEIAGNEAVGSAIVPDRIIGQLAALE